MIRTPSVNGEGLPQFDPGSRAVYHPHILLRSWLALRTRRSIAIPAEVEELIEGVYRDGPCPDSLSAPFAAEWARTLEDLHRQSDGEIAEAQARWLKSPHDQSQLWRFTSDTREEDSPQLHTAFQALTRLTEPSVTIVCLYSSGEILSFDPSGVEPMDLGNRPTLETSRSLLNSSVPVSDRRIVHNLMDQEAPDSWRRSPLLRHCRLLRLDSASRAKIGGHSVVVSHELGLLVDSDSSTC